MGVVLWLKDEVDGENWELGVGIEGSFGPCNVGACGFHFGYDPAI